MVADFREYNEEVQRVFPRCGIRKFSSVAVSIHVSSTSDSPNLTCKLMSEANLAMTKFSNGSDSRRGFLTMFYLQIYKANALFLDKGHFSGQHFEYRCENKILNGEYSRDNCTAELWKLDTYAQPQSSRSSIFIFTLSSELTCAIFVFLRTQ